MKPELFKEKSMKDWSKELNLSLARVYQLKRKNQLEAKINGTWVPGKKQAPKYFGKSTKDWAEEFDIPVNRARYLIKIGIFKQVIKTRDVNLKKPTGRLFQGKNLSQWAKELGITRERARQLANKNLLATRINLVNKLRQHLQQTLMRD
jgi:hypothetical protein